MSPVPMVPTEVCWLCAAHKKSPYGCWYVLYAIEIQVFFPKIDPIYAHLGSAGIRVK